jgi:hypothetical protein
VGDKRPSTAVCALDSEIKQTPSVWEGNVPRPTKTGLDYFPVDWDIDEDDKICLIVAEVGELAFGRLIKLLAKIYHDGGYYKKWDEETEILFASRKGIPLEELKVLVSCALKRGLFDLNIYQKYRILTSAGIQKRYVEVVKKRKNVCLYREICLLTNLQESISLDNAPETLINSAETGVNSSETPVNSGFSAQRKEEKRKEKNSSRIVSGEKTQVKNRPYLPLSKFLLDIQLEIDPKFKPKKKTQSREDLLSEWSNDFRLLVEADKRAPPVVKDVLLWLKNGSGKEAAFWRKTVSSGSGFRRNFPTMYRQYKEIAEKEMVELEEQGYVVEDEEAEFRQEAES